MGRGQHSSNWVSGNSTRTIHRSTTPSLSQTIWQRWASRQFLSLPIVQTWLPVTFAYSLCLEAVVMRQLRRWKRLWRRSLTCSLIRTSMGLQEVVGTVQVHCSRRRLLRRGLEFHVCSINKSAHTKKVWKLIVCTSFIYIYIYIYIYILYTWAASNYLNTFDWIPRIVSFFKSSSEDIWVFLLALLCLGQVGKESPALSRRLTYHLTDISAIKYHLMTKHNKDTDKLKSLDIRKILINYTKSIYKINNKNCLQIFEAIAIKKQKKKLL